MLGAVLFFAQAVAVGDEPAARPMPRVIEPDADRLVAAVLHRVIDGDSVELFVQGAVVRYELAGADSPDILTEDGKGDGAAILRGSAEARSYLKSLLDGEQLAVMTDPRRGINPRGHRRGYVYRMPDGLFVNLEMVRLGFSKHARDPSGFNDSVMLWAQDRARDARKGVWLPVPKPAAVDVVSTDGAGAVEVPEEIAEEVEVEQAVESSMVYVTEFGSKYHSKDCQHVRGSGIAKDRNEIEDSLKACKVCKPDDLDGAGDD